MAYGFHVYFGREGLTTPVRVRRIGPSQCFAALQEGLDDFISMRTYPAFVGFFYAIAGLAIVSLTSFREAVHLVFPLAAGFALVGPFVAIGLYEMSRRRERGLEATWHDAFAALRSPALPSIVVLGLMLFAIFAAWIGAAQALYVRLYGPDPPADAIGFFDDVLTTTRGWLLVGLGGLVGLCFAATSLCLSLVSFPLMLDRGVGLIAAIEASLRTAYANPNAVALWGLIVAAGLVLGSAPMFFGLAVVLPVLGHSTWRLYRRAIVRDPARELPLEVARRPDPTSRRGARA